jgi:hypothetical protein
MCNCNIRCNLYPERAARYDDFVFDSIKNKQPFYQIDQLIDWLKNIGTPFQDEDYNDMFF